jgi:hypothetical protein
MGKSPCVGCSDHSSAIPDALGGPRRDYFKPMRCRGAHHHRAVRRRLKRLFRGVRGRANPLRVLPFGAVVPPAGTDRTCGTLAVSSSLATYERHCRRTYCCVRFVGSRRQLQWRSLHRRDRADSPACGLINRYSNLRPPQLAASFISRAGEKRPQQRGG